MKNLKNKNKENLKSEKGAITLFVIIAMMFFLVILLVMYMGNMQKLRNQKDQIEVGGRS